MSEPAHITLNPDEILFAEGDEGSCMYVITKGRIRITKNIGGQPRMLTELGAGEFVGEMSILNHEPRSATGTAVESTTILPYTAEDFEELIATRPSIAVRIIRRLAHRLKETNDKLQRMTELFEERSAR